MRFPENIHSLYGLLTASEQTSDSNLTKVISYAKEGKGLTIEQAAVLLAAPPSWGDRIFNAAAELNAKIKGKIITFYGVVYIHDFCINSCRYCGDSVNAAGDRKLLSKEEFIADVETLLKRHPLKEICFLMGEDPKRFSCNQLIEYLQAVSRIYQEKIVLNIPPLSVRRYGDIRAALPNNRLHFRVFQETYDRDIYTREHFGGPKKDFDWRINSQARALEAGFDEVGHGTLFVLNENKYGHLFETLAMLAHAVDLYEQFGKKSQSISFPRIQPAPGINFKPSTTVDDDTLIRCVSVFKLANPQIDTVITCRENAAFRRRIRPIVNIEDFAARPGPGGNSIPEVRQQMFLPDLRAGDQVRAEMEADGYTVR